MNTRNTHRLRPIALLGATLLATASLTFAAAPAFAAAPGDGGEGTLTIHKLEQPAEVNLGPNDGSEIELEGAKPLVAGFDACAIKELDLSKASDWERIKDITITLTTGGEPIATEGGTALTLQCLGEKTTSAEDGVAVFDLPADRAYVVYESTPAANSIPGAEPTLITVPYPGNGAEGSPVWNYNPHIYPKNVIVGGGATKNGQVIGNKVTFDITVPIAPLGAGETYSEFRINDKLGDFLEYTAGTVTLFDADGDPVALTAGTDYTLTEPAGSTGDAIELKFESSGLAKLDANIGGSIVLTIKADAVGTGSTENVAEVTVNGTTSTGPEVIGPEEFFAGAHVLKQAKNKGSAENVPLAGATFDVYSAGAAATSCPDEPAAQATKVLEGIVSGDDGKTPTEVLGAGNYCVYETKAPSGYKPLVGGLILSVTDEDASVTVVNTQVGADEGDLPNLPITGAMGSVLLVAGGVALIAIATGIIISRRKKARVE